MPRPGRCTMNTSTPASPWRRSSIVAALRIGTEFAVANWSSVAMDTNHISATRRFGPIC